MSSNCLTEGVLLGVLLGGYKTVQGMIYSHDHVVSNSSYMVFDI